MLTLLTLGRGRLIDCWSVRGQSCLCDTFTLSDSDPIRCNIWEMEISVCVYVGGDYIDIFIKSIIFDEMKWSFHFGRNDMRCISFWPKWDVHFGHNEMEFISFRPEWNGHVISAEMKCHFFDSLKKYASWLPLQLRLRPVTQMHHRSMECSSGC